MRYLLRHRPLHLAAFLLWLAALWFLSSLPGSSQTPPPFQFSDKVAHFLYFFAGGSIVGSGLLASPCPPPTLRRLLFASAILLVAVGFSDELHQTLTPHRSGNDPGDLTADALGALAGAFFASRLHRRFCNSPAHRIPGSPRRPSRPDSTLPSSSKNSSTHR